MKLAVPLFLASLAANIYLVASLIEVNPTRIKALPVAAAPVLASEKGEAHIAVTPEAWKSLSEGGTEALVKRLRAEGFPPAVILALVRIELNLRYKEQFAALAREEGRVPKWQRGLWQSSLPEEVKMAKRKLHREIYAEERRLCSKEMEASEGFVDRTLRQAQYGSLSMEKVRALEDLLHDYSDLEEHARNATMGVWLPEDRERLAYIEGERRKDLAQLLSPAELEDYDRRASVSAQTIQKKIAYLEASEEEYLRLYAVQKAFDEKYGISDLSGAQAERRREAEKTLGREYEAVLGPERYAEFQVVSDANFAWTRDFVSESELAPEMAKALVRLEQASKEQAAAIRSDKSLDSEQRSAALAKLSEEAAQKVSSLVGQDNVDRFKKGAGGWLMRLNSAAKAKPNT